MPDVELLNRTLQHIEAHPETWEQDWWITPAAVRRNSLCGTAYCFAGHAVVQAGHKVSVDSEVVFDELPEHVRARIDPAHVYQGDDDVAVVEVARAAAALLDIEDFYTPEPHLFDATNTLADLERMVADLCGETVGAGA